jgi:group I intron endonuclease
MKIPCDVEPIGSLHIKGGDKIMIGIYMLKNKVNDKIYIGQSTDIDRRMSEHRRSAYPEIYAKKSERDSQVPIHRAMHKYGWENFELIILEECEKEKLDEREIYWIGYYSSNVREIGYNLTAGGKETLAFKGEKHSQAKLTEKDVLEIKYLLKNTDLSLTTINKMYPQVSRSSLTHINIGASWDYHNDTYPLRKEWVSQKGEQMAMAKFSDAEVMELRTQFSEGKPFRQILEENIHKASESAIRKLIYGESYKHLPIWRATKKQWV